MTGSHRRAWIFVVPAFVAVVALQVYPLVQATTLSFQHWSLVDSPAPSGFSGLVSFREVLSDPVFWQAARTSATITVAAVSVELVLGVLIALLLRATGRRRALFQTIVLVPMVIAPVAAGNIWRLMLDSQTGWVNNALGGVGITGPDWLSDSRWAVVAVTVVDIWQWTPFVVLVISGALIGIPESLLEASSLDGANRVQTFLHVEMPLLLRPLVLVATFRILDSLLTLDTVYALTQGGPGYSTYTLTYYLYSLGLKNFQVSAAAAGSWVFMVAVSALILFMFLINREGSPRPRRPS